jgi:hypothetical protein
MQDKTGNEHTRRQVMSLQGIIQKDNETKFTMLNLVSSYFMMGVCPPDESFGAQ